MTLSDLLIDKVNMFLTEFVVIPAKIDKIPGRLHCSDQVYDEQGYGDQVLHDTKVSRIVAKLYDLDHKTLAGPKVRYQINKKGRGIYASPFLV